MDKWRSPRGQYLIALGISSLIALGMFTYGAWHEQSLGASYLVWNLFLAWLPLLLALRLMHVLRHKLWSSWEGLATSLVWIAFLPNSFYLISDFIHLQDMSAANILYDTIMFTAFVSTGVALGFSSLYLVHWQLRRRFTDRTAAAWIGVILLLCSIAIYLGRDLRWNTWDILVNPAGLLFEISDRLWHPTAYPQMLLVIAAFFVLLAGLYNLLWHSIRLFLRQTPRPPAAASQV
ncbi:MAG TPA: DUF1361 domain-containing protein [Candidatus Saccharimonadales bacterium]|nr:DUF1361 domain-containing protein [Candidatus Saccharimonadales bacterium]